MEFQVYLPCVGMMDDLKRISFLRPEPDEYLSFPQCLFDFCSPHQYILSQVKQELLLGKVFLLLLFWRVVSSINLEFPLFFLLKSMIRHLKSMIRHLKCMIWHLKCMIRHLKCMIWHLKKYDQAFKKYDQAFKKYDLAFKMYDQAFKKYDLALKKYNPASH